MGKQIKIDFVLDIEDKPMTPNMLTPLLINFFNSQGWDYKGIIENLYFCEDEENIVKVNYERK